MKKVFISGINGNMGARYGLICRTLGLDVYGSDQSSFTEQGDFCVRNNIDGIIVATPTFTHVDAINIFGNEAPDIPVLIEKPIRLGPVETMPDYKLTMVNQYKYLVDNDRIGLTYYNYFKTGGDGLLWDCINIIGLAKTEVSIKRQSPFWRCSINGQDLNIKDMDKAYYDMLDDWTTNPVSNHEYIQKAHAKVNEMVKAGVTNTRKIKEPNDVKTGSQVLPIVGRNE